VQFCEGTYNPSSGRRVALCNSAKALKIHLNKTANYSQSMTTILRGFLVASGVLNGQDIWFVFIVEIYRTETLSPHWHDVYIRLLKSPNVI